MCSPATIRLRGCPITIPNEEAVGRRRCTNVYFYLLWTRAINHRSTRLPAGDVMGVPLSHLQPQWRHGYISVTMNWWSEWLITRPTTVDVTVICPVGKCSRFLISFSTVLFNWTQAHPLERSRLSHRSQVSHAQVSRHVMSWQTYYVRRC